MARSALAVSAAISSNLLWFAMIAPVQAEARPSPADLLANMADAVQTLNYEGSFVHVQNGNIEAMHILHSGDEQDGELERMLSLNGEAREVFRNRALVTCIWPDSNAVIVSDSKSRKLLPKVDASLASSPVYELKLVEPDRVAGKDTHVVDIQPRDALRYGHRFWIDKQTDMLLRSMLIDPEGKPIEQVMFTSISYPESIVAERFDLPELHRGKSSSSKPPASPLPSSRNRVDFEKLPPGYSEVSETYKPMPINDGPVSHVVVSDGMASVSVYIEYVKQSEQKDMEDGMSSMGAMNAYSHSLANAMITVVGEVPAATVKLIALAVRLVE